MDENKTKLIYGSLLHDIGKVVQRATNEKRSHSQIGADFFNQYYDNRLVSQMIRYHHYKDISRANLDADHLSYIVYIADNIASGTDRRALSAEGTSYFNWDSKANLADIFNLFKAEEFDKGERFYQPILLDDREEINYADENYRKFTTGHYNEIVEKIKNSFKYIHLTPDYYSSMLSLMESTLSYVPSSTNMDEVVDISLYDHLKLTSAVASCIYDYMKQNDKSDFKEYLFKNGQEFYNEEAFRLLSFDISGIQNFIYTIASSKAAKMLRSRSFYLEMLSENLVDEIITRLELSRANLIYSGGGHAYLLIPNTAEALSIIDRIDMEINSFLQHQFGHKLYISFASVPLTGAQMMEQVDEDNDIYNPYSELSQQIEMRKIQRYDANQIIMLNERGKRQGRECPVCHNIISLSTKGEICELCHELINFSKDIQREDFFAVQTDEGDLPLGFSRFLVSTNKDEIINDHDYIRIYAKNKFYTGMAQGTHLWIADYTDGRQFNQYAEDSDGIDRMGVMRCDVDNLGSAFRDGYDVKLDGEKSLNTFSRTATFSRNLSLFFKHHINQLLEQKDYQIQIIYSGGDDVLLVGNWSHVIEFSILLRQKFIEYTQGKLTLSTGVGIYPAKSPIAVLAESTGDLEDASKQNDKDSITLFSPEYTFKWDDFIDNVWNKKYQVISENLNNSDLGATFLYSLRTLISESFEEARKLENKRGKFKSISWARWVYYLARTEERYKTQLSSEFIRQLHEWFLEEETIKELDLAIILYLYHTRGE